MLSVYRLGLPKGEAKRLSVMVNAMLTSVILALVSAAFSKMIDMSANYSLLYGSLASIIVLLLWLYLCCTILLLGAAANRAWTSQHVK